MFIPYFCLLVFGILVTLVAWFSFRFFFRLAHLALQNVNKDYVIFLYFRNFVDKSDQKPKTKNGMNETTVVKIITNTLAASSYANIVGSTLSSSAACLMLIFPYFNCSRICRLPASKILDEGTMEGAPSLKRYIESYVFGNYLDTQFHLSNIDYVCMLYNVYMMSADFQNYF